MLSNSETNLGPFVAILPDPRTLGERLSDKVARCVGSWTFIIVQIVILAAWMAANVAAWIAHWDPYPFILLNLALSFQAAFTAPIIMMSQNRQSANDRVQMMNDYRVNLRAEQEIAELHQKLDLLRETEIQGLMLLLQKMESCLCSPLAD